MEQVTMGYRCEALVLGIGNVLWADEGFGVRAVEALHANYEFPEAVRLLDGGTQGIYLFDDIASSRRVLVLDCIDFGLAPGTLRVLRDREVPEWGTLKMSPHQTGFSEVLALARLRGQAPEAVTLIGVQPEQIEDLGGSLGALVRQRLPEAVDIAAAELAAWGYPGRRREAHAAVTPLNPGALGLDAYEAGRPTAAQACRIGDARVLAGARYRDGD
jgi:hydrogenase maturation protease